MRVCVCVLKNILHVSETLSSHRKFQRQVFSTLQSNSSNCAHQRFINARTIYSLGRLIDARFCLKFLFFTLEYDEESSRAGFKKICIRWLSTNGFYAISQLAVVVLFCFSRFSRNVYLNEIAQGEARACTRFEICARADTKTRRKKTNSVRTTKRHFCLFCFVFFHSHGL